jgi:hypothetical protein
VSFADRLLEDVATHRGGPKCLTCTALASLDANDLHAYHDARESRVPWASIARALGLQPGTYRLHVTSGHVEPR